MQRAENRPAELDADVKRVVDAEKYRRQTEAAAESHARQKKAILGVSSSGSSPR